MGWLSPVYFLVLVSCIRGVVQDQILCIASELTLAVAAVKKLLGMLFHKMLGMLSRKPIHHEDGILVKVAATVGECASSHGEHVTATSIVEPCRVDQASAMVALLNQALSLWLTRPARLSTWFLRDHRGA